MEQKQEESSWIKARTFDVCAKCGGFPTPRPSYEHITIHYYRKPRPPEVAPSMVLYYTIPETVSPAIVEHLAPGSEGFFIRCARCGYIWYEPLEVTQ
jgi:hypothetical protein